MTTLNVTALYALARALGGIPVLGCVPGSRSEQAGLQYGDVILAVNGQAVRDVFDFVRIRSRPHQEIETLDVFRAGAEVRIVLPVEGTRVSMREAAEHLAARRDLVGAASSRSVEVV